MPGFTQFSTEQIWQLVSYIRSLSAPAPTLPNTDSVAGNADAGRVLFAGKAGCVGCHMVNGAGNSVGPDLSGIGATAAAQLQAKIMDPNQAGGGRGPGSRSGNAAYDDHRR